MTKRLNLLTTSTVAKSQNDPVAETCKFIKNLEKITTPIVAKSNTNDSQSQHGSYLLKQHFLPGQLQIVSFQKPPFSPNESYLEKPLTHCSKAERRLLFFTLQAVQANAGFLTESGMTRPLLPTPFTFIVKE
jgi:hypothetical protein